MASIDQLMRLADFQAGSHSPSGGGLLGPAADIMVKNIQQKKKRELEKQKNNVDMFKTLRDAGYSSEKAFDAVKRGEFPEGPPVEDSLATDKKRADIDFTKARTEEIKTKNTTPNKARLQAKIMDKVAQGGIESLTPGEARIYNDTIKGKSSSGGGLSEFLNNNENEDSGELKVISPKGVKGSYKRSLWEKNKQKLLRKGWRLQ